MIKKVFWTLLFRRTKMRKFCVKLLQVEEVELLSDCVSVRTRFVGVDEGPSVSQRTQGQRHG